MDDKRNMVLAAVLAALILMGWPYVAGYFFPHAVERPAAQSAPATRPATGGTAAPAAEAAAPARTVAAALTGGHRVAIRTPKMQGSINLVGARVDDVVLTTQRETIDRSSPPVRLFAPGGTEKAYFAGFRWAGAAGTVPAADTQWQASGEALTPTTPVTLSWTNATGQTYEIILSVDADYMISATQRVTNRGAAPIAVRPYSYLSRIGTSPDPDSWTLNTGAMGVFGGTATWYNRDEIDEATNGRIANSSTGGWIGFTDHFWLGALIPAQTANVDMAFQRGEGGRYQADLIGAETVVQPGRALSTPVRLFAGAKETRLLDRYTDGGIPHFDRANDWGWFWFFAKPIFYLLDWLFRLVGNFGVAIILLTLIIRLLMFPIAQKQFASMAAMRIVQPKLKAIQEKYKDDKPRLQQEMMELYKREKINPLAGCLPILIQIPIFYALYKTLMLAVEMRHQPFALWIKDLSAPDPLHILNLFGLLPFTPPAFLGIGVLAVLLGVTMWAQFKLNPPPPDPVQAQMFSIMPWVLMFVMAPFAAGLLLYWITNNILSIGQQRLLYARYPEMKQAVEVK